MSRTKVSQDLLYSKDLSIPGYYWKSIYITDILGILGYLKKIKIPVDISDFDQYSPMIFTPFAQYVHDQKILDIYIFRYL
jgi:hypothetical protein